jgi:hypothetical protein
MAEFTTTVAGATRRQKEVRKAAKWISDGSATVHLVAEPENPHDANAIRVEVERRRTFGGERVTVGYLPAHVAAQVTGRADELEVVDAYEREPDDEFDFWNIALTIDDPSHARDHDHAKAAARLGGTESASTTVVVNLKRQRVFAAVTFVVGVVLMVAASVNTGPGGQVSGVYTFVPLILFVGLVWFIVTSGMLWWLRIKARWRRG